MIDFKKYKRFFAFGCSMTNYYWPTWADIIAKEIPESYNYGQSGGGNLFISNQIAEANQRFKFNKDDLVIVMWTGVSREDRWVNGRWLTPGNIFSQGVYNDEFVAKFSDPKGYLIRDLGIITITKHMLESLNIDYYMLAMSPFTALQNYKKRSIDDVNAVFEVYDSTVKELKPDLLTAGCDGHWPQVPIRHSAGQTADYHPTPKMHYNYLTKIFPGINFSSDTIDFVETEELRVRTSSDISMLSWKNKEPTRL